MQNKLAALITLAAAAHATSLQAGIFSFLKGKAKPQEQPAPSGSSSRTSSRAEARVDQHGSIMRTGSNTAARVTENGSVSLSKGVVLVSSGDGLMRRPPVQISTPQGDVTVRGSAIVAALPDGSVKMTVLEGHAKGSLGGKDMALDPGQLMIQRHETRDAVKVDLGALTASSALLDGSQYQLPLPAAPQIQSEVVQQVQALGGSLALSGGSHQVTNATELKMAKNADAAGSGTGATSGATFSIRGSNYQGSGGVITLNSSATLASPGTIPAGTATHTAGALQLSTPSSVPGTNPSIPSGSGLTISGSNIVLNTGGGTSVSGLNSLVLGGSGNVPPVVGSGTLTLTRDGSSTVVLTPGATQTGQITTLTATGATLPGTTTVTAGSLNAPSGTTLTPGSALQIPGSSTSTSPSSSQAFGLIDWMALGGGSAPSPGSSGNLALPDLTGFTAQWDITSLNSMGIIVVVGGGYTGPGSLPPNSNPATPPAAQP